MTARVGLPTLRLVRVAIGPWRLDGLAPGQWREVDVATARGEAGKHVGAAARTIGDSRPRRRG